MGLLDDVDARREREQNTRENSARLAQAYSVFKTTGQGTQQYEERVDFGLTFIEEPVVAYGGYCDIDALADEIGADDTDTVAIPLTSGMVTEWDRDERGFYAGCWVAVRVYFPPDNSLSPDGEPMTVVDPTAKPEMKHHFTFSAIAMKDIPPDVDDSGVG